MLITSVPIPSNESRTRFWPKWAPPPTVLHRFFFAQGLLWTCKNNHRVLESVSGALSSDDMPSVLMFQGKCLRLWAKPAHPSGHLPVSIGEKMFNSLVYHICLQQGCVRSKEIVKSHPAFLSVHYVAELMG